MPYNNQGFSEMLWGNDRISNETKNQLQRLMEAILGTQEGSGAYNQAVGNMNQVIYGDQFTDWDARDALAAFFPNIANNGYRVTANDAMNNSWDRQYTPPETTPVSSGIDSQNSGGMQNTTGGQTPQSMPQSNETPGQMQSIRSPQGSGAFDFGTSYDPGESGAGNAFGGLMRLIQGMMTGDGASVPVNGVNRGLLYGGGKQAYQQEDDANWEAKIAEAQKQVQDAVAKKYEKTPYQQATDAFNQDRKNSILANPRGRETAYWLQNKPVISEDNPFMQDYMKKFKEGGM